MTAAAQHAPVTIREELPANVLSTGCLGLKGIVDDGHGGALGSVHFDRIE